jgi:hypothetical protein
MIGGAQIIGPDDESTPELRVQAAIERLLSQHGDGIQVRLSNENQAFLNTRRPTRVGIPAPLLQSKVPGFVAGKKAFLEASYGKTKSYHLYNRGMTWVPTLPRGGGEPDDIFDMKVELLTRRSFLRSFPRIGMGTRRPQAWMTEWSEVAVSQTGNQVELTVEQYPSVEGIARYVVKGRLVEDLVFQTGTIFTVIQVKDAFSESKFLQLHHNGHKKAWVSLNKRKAAKIKQLTFDGFRLRVRYGGRSRRYGTVIYLEDPSKLYSLGACVAITNGVKVDWAGRAFFVKKVTPRRGLEAMMVQHADFYETGRIGAEIAYSILKDKLEMKNLILNEPGRAGPDLRTRDGRVLAESRFIIEIAPDEQSAQISRDLAQMTRKTRREFRRNPEAEVGYAVISFLRDANINSMVVEVASRR